MKGVEAEKYLRYAKETLARILKVEERELLFTSGGTESDNMALIGCALANCRRGNHLITTQIEHPAILQTMRYLETQGYRVTYLPVDPCGRIRLEDLRIHMEQRIRVHLFDQSSGFLNGLQGSDLVIRVHDRYQNGLRCHGSA